MSHPLEHKETVMSLRDFLATSATRASKPALQVVSEAADTPEVAAPQAPASAPAAPHYGHSAAYLALRARIHAKLLERFDLAALESLPTQTLQQEIASMTERLLEEDSAVVNDLERRLLIRDIQHEMLGFGPLELLMTDPAISDILVNRHDQIYVERLGRLELTPVVFTDDKHLLRIIDKIVSRIVAAATPAAVQDPNWPCCNLLSRRLSSSDNGKNSSTQISVSTASIS